MEKQARLESTGIREIRMRRQIGQKELASLAHVDMADLRKCERGLAVPDMGFFKSIGAVLDVPGRELMLLHQRMRGAPVSGEGYVTSVYGGAFTLPRKRAPRRNAKKVLDLFCGVGGFSHGFEQTGEFDVVSGIDLLEDRARTFSLNHEAAITYCADMREFPASKFEEGGMKPDVIIGGPPCQGFSSIRPFRSVNDSDVRNNLLGQFAGAVSDLRPEWFVMENVVGLATHQQGSTLSSLLSLFKGAGYNTSWKVLNAVHFGLPQRRERLFIVGNRNGKAFRFPKPTHYFNGRSMVRGGTMQGDTRNLKRPITVIDAIGDLPEVDAGREATGYSAGGRRTEYARALRGKEQKLTMHRSTAHSKRLVEIIRHAGPNISSIPKGMVRGFSTSYSRLEPDEPSVTLTVNFTFPGSNKCIHPYQNRALTPREGARLQGFEDGYVFAGSRNQIVKQIGNAVPPILGRVIAESILAH